MDAPLPWVSQSAKPCHSVWLKVQAGPLAGPMTTLSLSLFPWPRAPERGPVKGVRLSGSCMTLVSLCSLE